MCNHQAVKNNSTKYMNIIKIHQHKTKVDIKEILLASPLFIAPTIYLQEIASPHRERTIM